MTACAPVSTPEAVQLRPEQLDRRRLRIARRARLVGWAKVLLPVAALVVIGAIFMAGRGEGDLADLFTPEELARLGAGLRLDNPRLAGITGNDQPYQLTAVAALPDGPMAERITFERPSGHIETPDRTVRASAESGLMDRSAERLELSGGVAFETSDGWQAETESVSIDLDRKSAAGAGSLRATGPNGSLEAGSFRVTSDEAAEDAPTIWFENGVRVVFIPPGE